ncbi:MAG: DUF418 domain-containing protein [Actinomycetota bacterium]
MTNQPTTAAPVVGAERITNLDTVRGIALLGILLMNAVSFGLPQAAYFNLDAAGSDTPLDWAIGILGEIFVDQKFMGLFSLLFGAGIVLFCDRAEAKGRRAVALSLSRNAILLIIGVIHSVFWEGDILLVYALASPVLLAARRLPPRALIGLGLGVILLSPLTAIIAQSSIDADGTDLGGYWWVDADDFGEATELYVIVDVFARAIGMMLIGVALYRTGLLNGTRPAAEYRRLAAWGLGLGIPLATASVVWFAATDFGPEAALVGTIPNTIGTVPMVLGYLAIFSLWNQREETGLHLRLRAVGRMALTNYLAQTALGLTILGWALDGTDLTRTGILVFCVAVWAVQLAWSPWWLDRFRFGPVEWLWRVATYRRITPLRR